MNDEQLELVTAYVDGEATADERASVEADAELLAEVEFQRAARAELHDVEPPSDDARESAIAAALAVFDTEVAGTIRSAPPSATPDVTAPTNIVPFEQRRRMRWMQSVGAAAAVAAVVAAGAVIATRGGGDNGSTANEARDNAELSVTGGTLDQNGTDQAPVATTDGSVLMAVEPTQDPLADEANAAEAEGPTGTSVSEYDTNSSATGGAPAGVAPTTVASAPAAPAMPAPDAAATQRLKVVITEEDLREFADTLDVPPLDVDAAERECADGALAPEATFEDEAADQREIVIVAIDDDTIGALALDDCEVVLEADLAPTP